MRFGTPSWRTASSSWTSGARRATRTSCTSNRQTPRRTPTAHLQQVVTIALVFATHAGTVDRLATATAIDPETGTVAGRLYVNRRVIDEYRRDAISKQAYAREVASTYRGRSIDA